MVPVTTGFVVNFFKEENKKWIKVDQMLDHELFGFVGLLYFVIASIIPEPPQIYLYVTLNNNFYIGGYFIFLNKGFFWKEIKVKHGGG